MHETVHTIQTDAYGGAWNFMQAYKATSNYYPPGNPFEEKAYNFGGNINNSTYENTYYKDQIMTLYTNWW